MNMARSGGGSGSAPSLLDDLDDDWLKESILDDGGAGEQESADSICEHFRQQSQCHECAGDRICEHFRQQSRCPECTGSRICDHGRQQSRCEECAADFICDHGRMQSRCEECAANRLCDHGRVQSQCDECAQAIVISNLQAQLAADMTESSAPPAPSLSAADSAAVRPSCCDMLLIC
jgi:hypothetical protein